MKLKLVFAATFYLVISGCAVLGPSAEESARMSINKMFVAQKAGDIESTMALFSDSYSDPQGANKALVRQYIGGLIYENVFTSMSMSMDNAIVSMEDEMAIVAPVTYSGPAGNSSWSFRVRSEEDGVWRIVSSKQIQ